VAVSSDARAPAGEPAPGARLAAAVGQVRAGGLLGFPTETVWGLGADAASPAAVARLRAWKGREGNRPLSILVTGPDALAGLGLAWPPAARALAEAFWPGPLTLVVPGPPPGRAALAPGVARADGAVGLRCSPDPTAAALARALADAGVGPLTATSLNRSGHPPAASPAAARALAGDDPGLHLLEPLAPATPDEHPAASPVSCSAPSTVVDCTGPAPRVIREGAIAAAALEAAVATALGAAVATAREAPAAGARRDAPDCQNAFPPDGEGTPR